ncbi:E3 ubiquitin-protein ligase RNF128 [Fistulifera solaris]|uniref:E3 ubiquitin-protein ligase RNF128 n=1 Tax=Fistulifera solaris TaxID=1519565 RepID=A0A1Z5K0I0_FISSO|nr:E3 ubiquitin-protein ligase RNF128 [Fistulifera solaris]|eukprot:GAX19790.1 E3 ubiquitin-protein ligase RNF128 [Fistulifera solaris]
MRAKGATDREDPLSMAEKRIQDCDTEASSPLSTTSSRYSCDFSNESSKEESSVRIEDTFPCLHDPESEDHRMDDPLCSSSIPMTPLARISISLSEDPSGSFYYESAVCDGDAPKMGLRASLDAGMAAITNWIRAKREVKESDDAHHSDDKDDEHCNQITMIRPRLCNNFDLNCDASYEPSMESDHRRPPRHRTQSEPDAARLRNHLLQAPRVRRRRGRAATEELPCSAHSRALTFLPHDNIRQNNHIVATDYHGPSTPGRSSIEMTTDASNNSLNTMTSPIQGDASNVQGGSIDLSRTPGTPARISNSSLHATEPSDSNDPERRARMRWIRINRRFQLVITFVALLFSLLLFAVLVCWVVLTSSYVVSFDKSCDVPLKPYFWLVTLQLVLDVFRTDIMRVVFSWDGTSNQRIPVRVVAYNIAYLIYAVLVLRLGINSVFVDRDNTCRDTAPELYNASAAFISLSIAAWATIICGYLLPFCIVAALLTYNGYNPSSSQMSQSGASQPVFPAAYSNTGAPSTCIEMLPIVQNVTSGDYPRECCICMEDFRRSDVVVETYCKHVFHKQCCREWLLQARSCPICRTDIPSHLNMPLDDNSSTPSRQHNIPLGPTGRPVVGLLRILSHADSVTSSSGAVVQSPLRARTLSSTVQDANPDIEEGFRSR